MRNDNLPVRRPHTTSILAGILMGAALLAVGSGPAVADSGGALGETIYQTPPVRSITVVTFSGGSSLDMCTVAKPLTFPDGHCKSSDPGGSYEGVTITNGEVPGHVDVEGADAVPVDGGTTWQLCGGTGGTACTGPANTTPPSNPPTLAGPDQYEEATFTEGGQSPVLTDMPQCDTAFLLGTCDAGAFQYVGEGIDFIGPTASTDQSSTFTSSVIWTAAP